MCLIPLFREDNLYYSAKAIISLQISNSKFLIEKKTTNNSKTEKDHYYIESIWLLIIFLIVVDGINLRLFIFKFMDLPEHKSWQGRRVLPRTQTEEGPPPHRFL